MLSIMIREICIKCVEKVGRCAEHPESYLENFKKLFCVSL